MNWLVQRIAGAIGDRSSGAAVVVGDCFIQRSRFASQNKEGVFISRDALTWRVVALQTIFRIPHAVIQKTDELHLKRMLALDMLTDSSAFQRIEPTRQNAERGGKDDVEDRPRSGNNGYTSPP